MLLVEETGYWVGVRRISPFLVELATLNVSLPEPDVPVLTQRQRTVRSVGEAVPNEGIRRRALVDDRDHEVRLVVRVEDVKAMFPRCAGAA